MRVPLKWLSEYVDLTLDPGDLAGRLTIAGAEVGEVITSGGDWDGVTVGRVVDVSRHPNADRLVLATGGLGGPQHTAGCGAPHAPPGPTRPASSRLSPAAWSPRGWSAPRRSSGCPTTTRGSSSWPRTCR